MIWILLVIFQLKHLVADYFLQGKYMLGKFKGGTDWIMPLFAHAMVHAAFTFAICLYFAPQHAVLLAALDATIHFIMDRIKASPSMLGRFKALSANEYREIAYEQEHYIKKFPGTQTSLNMQEKFNERLKSNVLFWWCLGVDQMVHHLTHYLVIYLILVLP